MSKVSVSAKVPKQYSADVFGDIVRQLENAVNDLAEGKIVARYKARSTAPTGSLAKGDFVPNTNTEEQGTAGAKYVLAGWICTTYTGTVVECRFLTGN